MFPLHSHYHHHRHNANPKMEIHRNENCTIALAKLTGAGGVRLVNISGEDIAGGNATITLGLVWTLILKFQIGAQAPQEESLVPPSPRIY
jgi:actinin alpha